MEEEVGILVSKVTFDEFLRVEYVHDFCILFSGILFVDVGNEAFTHFLNIIHRHVEIHLFFCFLHEIVLRQSIVNQLLVHYTLFDLF